ncbi:glycosyltransferase family 1 protein [Rossellomorea vietnamensis]|uniref:Glycosyltransferase family 1 protein n=1 Tax=Rossellomorea vietnamensis TaxID=218284 RepID=A0A5D4NIT4_9BACI|nr:glycosyltransferase [Rossellomorea vietnamensis]TYS13256.1 glycosyltransferase family 1 protein [Rossellomorea vietnamensis]
MLNLLFITKDTSNLIVKNYSYLEQELGKISNLMIWRHPGNLKEILERLPVKPDFILVLNDLGGFNPMVNGIAETKIPAGLFINDVHRLVQEREEYIKDNAIPYLFSVYRDKFHQNYPSYRDRFIWFPHFINRDIYKDYGAVKENELLMLGAINGYYPFRKIVKEYYKDDKRFIYKKHPGYRAFSKQEESALLIGESYAKEINKAKIFFTDSSILNYPLLKYYEVPACKTLLLAPTFPELEDLGFIPDVHFAAVTENDFAIRAKYFLENEEPRNQIIDQGHNFILNNHTVQVRARQLVEKIKEIVSEK